MANPNQNYRYSSHQGKGTQDDTDFDQWARAVKQQMIAALRRRGNSEE